MSVQWIRRDLRLDMTLAVGLEAAATLLVRAKSVRQLDAAIIYNLRLWRIIRGVALDRPHLSERTQLLDMADHVAAMLALDATPCVDPRDVAFVAGRNLAVAGHLAESQAFDRARDALVTEWAMTDSRNSFEAWLMERLAQSASPA
ncbi:MAG: hypothetical protein NVV74_11310 [Magnetospirillum sp.]|nr:hypothetical protein [Magnetospirillum sp.]